MSMLYSLTQEYNRKQFVNFWKDNNSLMKYSSSLFNETETFEDIRIKFVQILERKIKICLTWTNIFNVHILEKNSYEE